MSSDAQATAILLRSGDADAWRFAVDLAGAGVASNSHVVLVLFDAALEGLLRPSPPMLSVLGDLTLVRSLGRSSKSFVLIACSGAVERAKADPDGLVDVGILDDVIGLPAIWRRTALMRLVTI